VDSDDGSEYGGGRKKKRKIKKKGASKEKIFILQELDKKRYYVSHICPHPVLYM
jgi:hypothetical protein